MTSRGLCTRKDGHALLADRLSQCYGGLCPICIKLPRARGKDDVLCQVQRWVVHDETCGYALVHPRLQQYMPLN
jgi:hypothetical protein